MYRFLGAVKRITEELCGLNISSTQVSRLSKALDEELEEVQGVLLDDLFDLQKLLK